MDLILRAYEVVESRGLAINVATGLETSINTLVRGLLEVLDAANHPIVYTPERAGDVRRHCADVSRARTLLGLHPHPLSNTQLRETIDYYLGDDSSEAERPRVSLI